MVRADFLDELLTRGAKVVPHWGTMECDHHWRTWMGPKEARGVEALRMNDIRHKSQSACISSRRRRKVRPPTVPRFRAQSLRDIFDRVHGNAILLPHVRSMVHGGRQERHVGTLAGEGTGEIPRSLLHPSAAVNG